MRAQLDMSERLRCFLLKLSHGFDCSLDGLVNSNQSLKGKSMTSWLAIWIHQYTEYICEYFHSITTFNFPMLYKSLQYGYFLISVNSSGLCLYSNTAHFSKFCYSLALGRVLSSSLWPHNLGNQLKRFNTVIRSTIILMYKCSHKLLLTNALAPSTVTVLLRGTLPPAKHP